MGKSFINEIPFKKGKPFPDPDAKIGYCAAKKLAFVGYRATFLLESSTMPILAYYVTPANQYDSSALLPILLSLEENGFLPWVKKFYGDNAYFTEKNLHWLDFFEKHCKFQGKEESGKYPSKKRSAKEKSRIRSKIEAMFGILEENYNFRHTEVRGGVNVRIETSLKASAWNLSFLLSYLVGRFEDRISLRKLFYEN